MLDTGFWAFDVSGGEPYIQGAKNYLYDAIGWARSSGLKLIVSLAGISDQPYAGSSLLTRRSSQIDLHGAPGSQNGG